VAHFGQQVDSPFDLQAVRRVLVLLLVLLVVLLLLVLVLVLVPLLISPPPPPQGKTAAHWESAALPKGGRYQRSAACDGNYIRIPAVNP